MFEIAEIGQKIDKDRYAADVPPLRERLIAAQQRLLDAPFSVIVEIAGIDSLGRNDTVNLLHEWLDPLSLQSNAFGDPTEEERERPRFWRYWRALPPHGRIGIFYGSWARQTLIGRIDRRSGEDEFERAVRAITYFERQLADGGTLILKFWLHLSEKALGRRLEALQDDPSAAWRVNDRDWAYLKEYPRVRRIQERFVRRTSTAKAPWFVVESADDRFRNLTIGHTLLEALTRRLEAVEGPQAAAPPDPTPISGVAPEGARSILDTVDLGQSLEREEYQQQLAHWQGRLHELSQRAFESGLSTVLVFEGWDAAGKGGAIRRIVRAIDARDYRIIRIGVPTEEERSYHYLWRFWRHVPRSGRTRIFDRSWYGRVLVERVEGFATEPEWRRAYREIREFEEQLVQHGTLLLKFWIHIDRDEQLRRFRAREEIGFKRYKITEDDYRNRERWDAYDLAVNEMIERTSAEDARWALIAGNDKRFARVEAIRTLCEALEERLKPKNGGKNGKNGKKKKGDGG